MSKRLTKAALHIVSFVAFIYSGVMGVFAPAGVCCIIWGDDILHTALDKPPDYGHPAFYLWMLLMLPSMLLGFTGGFFLVVVPLYSAFHLRVLDSPANIETTRRICNWYIRVRPEYGGKGCTDQEKPSEARFVISSEA